MFVTPVTSIASVISSPMKNDVTIYMPADKKTGNIYFSLAAIKNVGEGVAIMIQEERQNNGIFKNLTDFLKRVINTILLD